MYDHIPSASRSRSAHCWQAASFVYQHPGTTSRETTEERSSYHQSLCMFVQLSPLVWSFQIFFYLDFFLQFFSLSFYFFWLVYSLSFFKFCSILLFSHRLLSSIVVFVFVLFFFFSLWRWTWLIKFIFSVLVADFSEQVSGNGPLPHRRRALPGGVQTTVHTARETRAEGIDSEWLAVMYRHHPANTRLLSHFCVCPLYITTTHHPPSTISIL